VQSLFEDIKDFHQRFELEYKGPPRQLPDELGFFRAKFIGEEFMEYLSDHKNDVLFMSTIVHKLLSTYEIPLEKKLDALVDLVYVALGTAYLHGFDFDEAWRRVHEANMKKVRAERKEQSLRGSTFDVVKPLGWKPPDLSDLVRPPEAPRKDTRIVYGAMCSWWGTIREVGNRDGIPCCPHCKNLLFEMSSPDEWWEGVDKHVADGHPGYRAFIEWLKGKCFTKGFPEAKIAYEAETGKSAL
jgi:predicted HAD superfamily Cof-like phosphohydrolase